MADTDPKKPIYDREKFQQDRGRLGSIIQKDMKTTGGTDVDWMIEHWGGFIVLEEKTFERDWIQIGVGQIILFEQLYKKLNSDGRCHFFIIGFERDADFSNLDTMGWYFDMDEWNSKRVCPNRTISYGTYNVHKRELKSATLSGFKRMIEKFWTEFEKPEFKPKFEHQR